MPNGQCKLVGQRLSTGVKATLTSAVQYHSISLPSALSKGGQQVTGAAYRSCSAELPRLSAASTLPDSAAIAGGRIPFPICIMYCIEFCGLLVPDGSILYNCTPGAVWPANGTRACRCCTLVGLAARLGQGLTPPPPHEPMPPPTLHLGLCQGSPRGSCTAIDMLWSYASHY